MGHDRDPLSQPEALGWGLADGAEHQDGRAGKESVQGGERTGTILAFRFIFSVPFTEHATE